jgi:curli biogenesis system outer membrane secretion channel CsgG
MNRLRLLGLFSMWMALALIPIARAHAAPDATAKVAAMPDKTSTQADERVAVAIYEFRSSVTEIPARGATDMFIDALVRAGQFRVVERSQLTQSLLMERQLGAQGITAGENAPMRAARYLFEGTISEANASETQHSGSFDVAGFSIGGGKNKDVIGIDVRVVDAHTGDVLDTISVHKAVKSSSSSVSGIGNLLGTVLAQHGQSTAYTPNVNLQGQHKESLDVTLRELINDAVSQLTRRLSSRGS